MRRSYASVGALIAITAAAPAILAQNRACITGLIQDASGAGVENAVVTVLDQETGVRRVTRSKDGGVYGVSTLAAGDYKVTVRKDGFRTITRLGLQLERTHCVQADFVLEIGSVQETITIEGTAPAINTEDGAARLTFERVPMRNLPLQGRGIQGLVELAAGVVATPATAGEAGQFTANGQRPNTNYFLVDGLSANNAVTGTGLPGQFPGASLPAMTAIGTLHAIATLREAQEVRIQTSTFAPEFGRTPGAQVAVTTRSGTNELHGEAFYSGRHNALEANNWFANRIGAARARSRMNDFGGLVGGPLRRNQTFFLANFEAMQLDQPFTWRLSVPSARARSTGSVLARELLNAFPVPNGPDLNSFTAEHNAHHSWPSSLKTGGLRLDQALGARGTAFLRYKETVSDSRSDYLQVNDAEYRNRSVTLGAITTISATATNDTRINISRASSEGRWVARTMGGARPADLSKILAPLPPGPGQRLYSLWIGGVGQLVSGDGGHASQGQWNLASTFSLAPSRHQVRFGIDYQRLTPTRDEPLLAVAGAYGSVEEFLAGGVPLTTTLQAGAGSSLIEYFSLFAQDTWALGPRLNLTYGARWEFTPAPSFRGPGVPGGGLVTIRNPDEPSFGILGGMPNLFVGPDWKASYGQIAPRAGVAWRMNESGTMVLRAGAGVFYDTNFLSAIELLNGAPFNRWRTLAAPADEFATAESSVEYGYAPGLRLPYTLQWNTTLEREFGGDAAFSIGYVGSAGRRLLRREGYADPSLGDVRRVLATNHGFSDFHSVQLQYRRRLSRQLGWMAAYTWGHSIDNGSWDSALFLAAPGQGRHMDRGSSDFDVRQSLQAALVWNVPRLANPRGWSQFAENWTVSSIFRARSGFPMDVISAENPYGLGFDNSLRPDLVPGVPVWIVDPAEAAGRRLNPAAFRLRPGEQGSLGRNGLRGFGMTQMDLALQREFRLSRASVRLRLEGYNLWNQAQFADPVRYLSDPFFGRPVSTLSMMLGRGRPNAGMAPAFQAGGPRTAQIGLQIRF